MADIHVRATPAFKEAVEKKVAVLNQKPHLGKDITTTDIVKCLLEKWLKDEIKL